VGADQPSPCRFDPVTGATLCYTRRMRIIGLAGWSGSGKTTLLVNAIPRLLARGLTVSTLKHAHHDFDLVIIEGYKREPHPKLEVHRSVMGKPLLAPTDPAIVAIAADGPLPSAQVPVVPLDDIERIADLLMRHAAPLTSVLGQVGTA
jgi:molybdopterin-guanine dinucleotide biosynthesis protein B